MHCLKYNITHSFHPCQVQWNAGNSYSSDCYSYQIKALDKALSISGHMMWLFFDRLRSRGEAVLFTSIVIKSQGQVIPAKFIIWLKKKKEQNRQTKHCNRQEISAPVLCRGQEMQQMCMYRSSPYLNKSKIQIN